MVLARVLIGMAVVTGLSGCTAPHSAALPSDAASWRADLRYLAEQLPALHQNAFRTASAEEFKAAVDALDARIPDLTTHQIALEMARVVTLLGDLHTRIEFWQRVPFNWFPIYLQSFQDGTYVIATTEPYRHLLGAQLTRVEGRSLAEVRRALADVIPHENDAKLNVAIPAYLRASEVLFSLGLTGDPRQATFTFEGEETSEVVLQGFPSEHHAEWVALTSAPDRGAPLYQRHRGENYWFQFLPESGTLYCAYNDCSDMPSESFSQFTDRLLTTLDEQPVERFVLDLRNNGGGDSRLAMPLIRALKDRPQINQTGRLFCIVGNRTFSSAGLNALQLRSETEAIFVGEPTGQRPNSFGEMRSFRLPNSGMLVTYPTRFFKLVAGDPESFMPDIEIGTTFFDYLAGHDPAMDVILAYDDRDDVPGAPAFSAGSLLLPADE